MKKSDETSAALPFEAAKPEETFPLLQSGVPRKSRLQCWSPGRKHSYTSRIVKVHETAGLISISVSKEFQGGEAFEKGLLRDSVGEILFSLHLPTDVIFFKGELRKGDSTYFNARIKDALYKVQRREALRLPVPGARTVLIEPSIGVGYSAELQNISEGGIGVVFRNKEEFESASALKSPITLTFTAFGLAIVVQAAVRHGAEVSSTMTKKTYRLGFSFVGIEPKLLVQISQLVFEESAKYLGRF